MESNIINIATLTIDKTEVGKSIVDTKQQIFDLQQANSDLRKDIKKNGDITGEQTKKFVENEQQLKKLNTQYRAQSEAVADLTLAELRETAALKENAKSIGQAATQNKELIKIRNTLDATTKDGATAIDLINKKLEANRQFTNANSSALEKQRDNIGNYPDSLGKMENALGGVGGAFGQTAKQVIGFGRNISEISDKVAQQVVGFGENIRTQIGFKSSTVQSTEATVAQTVATEAQTVATEVQTVATATATTGFKLLRLAIIGTGIGALIIAILAVKEAFTSSEEGQNKYAKLMGVIGALTGNLSDLLASLGDKIIAVFENPKKALESFGKLIKENIINRFVGLAELIPNIGKAIGLLLSGEFKKAGAVMVDSVGKVTLGVADLTGKINGAADAVKKFASEQAKEAALAAQVADKRARADIIERDLLVERARLESQIAELKRKSRDEDNLSAKERQAAIKQVTGLEDTLLNKEKQYLTLRRDAIALENTFSRTNKENKTKEAQANADIFNLETKRADNQRSTLRILNTINKQVAAEDAKRQKDRQDASKETLGKMKEAILAEVEENKKAFEEKKKLTEESKNEEVANAEFLKEIQTKRINESKLLEADKALALLEVQKGYLSELDVINKNFEASQKAAAEIARQEAQTLSDVSFELRLLELEDQGLQEAEVQKDTLAIQLEQKKLSLDQQLLEEKLTAEQVTAIKLLEDTKYAKATTKIDKQVAAAKKAISANVAKDLIGAAQAIFGESKALAIASALMNTYEGITAALKAPTIVQRVAGVTFAAGTGFAAVKNILKTDKGTTGGDTGVGNTSQAATVFENPARTQSVASVNAAPPIEQVQNSPPVLVLETLDEVKGQQQIKIKSN